MGEVYRAVDSNLGRAVAIKVLPDGFAADSDRLARFEREARTLAALNHPNIATVHGLERITTTSGAAASPALVMELVDGPTLADRIAEGPMELDEAMATAREIARALEAAHEQGIVHRDLKPANIKLRDDGAVKVLDFGLAKSSGKMPGIGTTAAAHDPTITTPAITIQGTILGTAAYMSPEQAKGYATDKRSDLWAFGCILFEMLAGKRAFEGESVTETLASVLRADPDWTALPPETPLPIVMLIKQLLVKDRRQRVGDIAAAIFVLGQPRHDARAVAPAGPRSRGWAPLAAAFLAGSAIAAGLAWWIARDFVTPEPKPVTRFDISLAGADVFGSFNSRLIDVSPDGRHVIYVANRRLNLRALDRLESVPIRGTEGTLPTDPPLTVNPTFSPDGQWIGFWHMGQLKKIALEGGAHVVILPAASDVSAFNWEADGTLLFAATGAIWKVPDTGGTPEKVLDGLTGRVQSLQFLPGKRSLLYTLFPPGSIATTEVTVHVVESGEKRILSTTGIDARYVSSGHLVFYDAGSLMAVPFDVSTLTTRGAARPMAENVASSAQPGRANTAAHFAISRSGTLVYLNGALGDSGVRTLVWVDRNGREEPVAGIEPRAYVYPRLSPDGRRIALTLGDEARDIWVWDFALRTLRRFSDHPDNERYAIWTPDGSRILFGSNRGNRAATWWQAADGSGDAELLATVPTRRFNNLVPTTISADGSRAVLTATGATTEGGTADLWMVTMTGERRVEPLLATTATERNAEISPDGRWVAYEAVDRDQPNIWVRPFPDVNRARWQVSSGGGSQPAWARNGKELFYRDLSGVVMSVPIEDGTSFEYRAAAKVVEGPYVYSVATYAGRLYDVSADGKRFLMMKAAGVADQEPNRPGITVVQNWFEELKRMTPP